MSRRGVTLDAAGTLIEVAEPVGVTYARIAGRHGLALAPDVAAAGFRAAFASAPPLGMTTERDVYAREWWRSVVRASFGAAAGDAVFEACFAELFAYYARADAWRVFPEVPDTLRQLRADGVALAVVSNFDARLPGILGGLGVESLVDAIVFSTGVGAAKPAPAIFHHAVAAMGASLDETIHCGNDPVADVRGARAAGLAAVLIDRTGTGAAVPPDVPTIVTLAELPAVTSALQIRGRC
jgi:putative hydrolase of the HAD superfamily